MENKNKQIVVAVDFDGTLCENAYPAIGSPKKVTIAKLLALQKCKNVTLILWTCRTKERLREAKSFCTDYGLVFDYVNKNTRENIAEFGGDNRKVYADFYVDDKNFVEDNANKNEKLINEFLTSIIAFANRELKLQQEQNAD